MLFFTSIVIFFLWTVIALFINQTLNPYFAFGNFEKHHGWFFYAALFILFFLLRQNSNSEHRRLFMMSFLGCAGVILYAIFQKL